MFNNLKIKNTVMEAFLQEAKASSRVISTLSGAEKNRILKETTTQSGF